MDDTVRVGHFPHHFNNFKVTAPGAHTGESVDQFNNAFQAKFGEDPGQWVAQAYDAAMLIMISAAAKGVTGPKIASGLKSLVLDVKVGNGSFNSTIEIARNLSNSLVSVAKGAGLKCEAILTDMNQVLGKSAGHTLEMLECIKMITNKNKDIRLEIITNELIASILMMVQKISKEDALKKINNVLSSGLAAEKFEKMVHALGGPSNILSSYENDLELNTFKIEIFSEQKGWIKKILTRDLGLILIELGGGRKQVTDKINFAVGYDNVLSVGDKADETKPLLTLYANTKEEAESVRKKIQNCFTISDNEEKKLPVIYETIN